LEIGLGEGYGWWGGRRWRAEGAREGFEEPEEEETGDGAEDCVED